MHPTTTAPATVFEYLDYLEFLRYQYYDRKRKSAAFSYRYMAGKLAMDPGSLGGIFKGRRKLNPALAASLGKVFGLGEGGIEYFQTLVLYGQAESPVEKNIFLEKLLRLRSNQGDRYVLDAVPFP